MQLQFYTQEALGATRSLTPEGFLLCQNVPLARTGTLLYADGEVPVDAGPNGIISIQREADQVFHPNAVASFAGKPVTNDHPPVQVDPSNWRTHAVGVVMHPRRGDGRLFDDQFLYADLLIQDHDAIRDVLEGKREVSAGYDAEYEQVSPGVGRQSQIIGNHVALVEKGRCGPRCAIGDSAMKTKPTAVARPSNRWARFRDAILTAHRSGDEQGVATKVNEMLGEMVSGTNDELNPVPTNEWEGDPREDDAGGKNVIIHVHGQANPGNSPLSTVGNTVTAPEQTQEAAPVPAVPAAAAPAPAAADPMAALTARLDRIEQALELLLKGDDPAPAADPAGDKVTGDEEPDLDGEHPEEVGTVPPVPSEKEFPEGTNGGRDRKTVGDANRVATADSRALATGWGEMVQRAMILVPDMKVPSFDTKAKRVNTVDAMCKFRKATLVKAYSSDDSRHVIDDLLGGEKPNFPTMSCDAAAILFNSAATRVRDANSRSITNARPNTTRGFGGTMPTPADINKVNRARYGI